MSEATLEFGSYPFLKSILLLYNVVWFFDVIEFDFTFFYESFPGMDLSYFISKFNI